MTDRERLRALAAKVKRFRDTPIVDEDFPAIRDDADWELAKVLQYLGKTPPQPKVVCLCGSTKFKTTWYEETKRLTHEGIVVLGVGDLNPNHLDTNVPIDPDLKTRLDQLHFRKIEMADEILVLNVGGYIGRSTANEIVHAHKLNVPIRWLELLPDGRPRLEPSSEAIEIVARLQLDK